MAETERVKPVTIGELESSRVNLIVGRGCLRRALSDMGERSALRHTIADLDGVIGDIDVELKLLREREENERGTERGTEGEPTDDAGFRSSGTD